MMKKYYILAGLSCVLVLLGVCCFWLGALVACNNGGGYLLNHGFKCNQVDIIQGCEDQEGNLYEQVYQAVEKAKVYQNDKGDLLYKIE